MQMLPIPENKNKVYETKVYNNFEFVQKFYQLFNKKF
jgi:hypothetical protein